jgi:hypothetical protein
VTQGGDVWTNVQSFLDTRSGVVKEAQQGVVTLPQQSRLIRLRQNGRNLFLLHVTDGSFGFFLRRDAKHLGTLSCRGWLAIGYKEKETSHCRQPTVTSGDSRLHAPFRRAEGKRSLLQQSDR